MDVSTSVRRMVLALALALSVTNALAQATYRIHVDGLACPFCAYGIEKKLAAVEGVERVETDIASGSVAVTMAEGATLDEAAARQAVNAAGFSLRRFERVGKGASGGPAK